MATLRSSADVTLARVCDLFLPRLVRIFTLLSLRLSSTGHLLPRRERRELRFTTALAARMAAPASAPRLSIEARTCSHCRLSLGVVACRVCLVAGILSPRLL